MKKILLFFQNNLGMEHLVQCTVIVRNLVKDICLKKAELQLSVCFRRSNYERLS